MDDESVRQLILDNERLKKSIALKDAIIEEYEAELDHALSNKKTVPEQVSSTELDDLRAKLTNTVTMLSDRDQKIEKLEMEKKSNEELVMLLRSELETHHEEQDNSGSSNMATFEAELEKLGKELTCAKKEMFLANSAKTDLEYEVEQLKENLEHSNESCTELKNELKNRQIEIDDLQTKLFELQEVKAKEKGNSMFAEVIAHERILENKVLELHKENMRLCAAVKRLQNEVQEAEFRGSLMCNERRVFARNTNYQKDLQELEKLKNMVSILEKEKFEFWRVLFAKMQALPKKALPSLIEASFQQININMRSLSACYDSRLTQLRELEKNNRYLTNINDQLNDKIDKLNVEIRGYERRTVYLENRLKRYVDEERQEKEVKEDTSICVPKTSMKQAMCTPSAKTPAQKKWSTAVLFKSTKKAEQQERDLLWQPRADRRKPKTEENAPKSRILFNLVDLTNLNIENPQVGPKKSLLSTETPLSQKANLVIEPVAEHERPGTSEDKTPENN